MSNSATPLIAAHQAPLSFTVSWSLLNSCPLSQWCFLTISCSAPLLRLPSIFPSIRVFSNKLALHIRWPKYWDFSFSMSPSNEYSGLMSFRINLFDLTVQGALKSLLQHHNSKASVFQHSAFFMSQLPHPYITTGKTIALIVENSYIRAYLMGKKLFVCDCFPY